MSARGVVIDLTDDDEYPPISRSSARGRGASRRGRRQRGRGLRAQHRSRNNEPPQCMPIVDDTLPDNALGNQPRNVESPVMPEESATGLENSTANFQTESPASPDPPSPGFSKVLPVSGICGPGNRRTDTAPPIGSVEKHFKFGNNTVNYLRDSPASPDPPLPPLPKLIPLSSLYPGNVARRGGNNNNNAGNRSATTTRSPLTPGNVARRGGNNNNAGYRSATMTRSPLTPGQQNRSFNQPMRLQNCGTSSTNVQTTPRYHGRYQSVHQPIRSPNRSGGEPRMFRQTIRQVHGFIRPDYFGNRTGVSPHYAPRFQVPQRSGPFILNTQVPIRPNVNIIRPTFIPVEQNMTQRRTPLYLQEHDVNMQVNTRYNDRSQVMGSYRPVQPVNAPGEQNMMERNFNPPTYRQEDDMSMQGNTRYNERPQVMCSYRPIQPDFAPGTVARNVPTQSRSIGRFVPDMHTGYPQGADPGPPSMMIPLPGLNEISMHLAHRNNLARFNASVGANVSPQFTPVLGQQHITIRRRNPSLLAHLHEPDIAMHANTGYNEGPQDISMNDSRSIEPQYLTRPVSPMFNVDGLYTQDNEVPQYPQTNLNNMSSTDGRPNFEEEMEYFEQGYEQEHFPQTNMNNISSTYDRPNVPDKMTNFRSDHEVLDYSQMDVNNESSSHGGTNVPQGRRGNKIWESPQAFADYVCPLHENEDENQSSSESPRSTRCGAEQISDPEVIIVDSDENQDSASGEAHNTNEGLRQTSQPKTTIDNQVIPRPNNAAQHNVNVTNVGRETGFVHGPMYEGSRAVHNSAVNPTLTSRVVGHNRPRLRFIRREPEIQFHANNIAPRQEPDDPMLLNETIPLSQRELIDIMEAARDILFTFPNRRPSGQ